ncbi:bifunctional phosphopantothenoylcysteine decarboxylase/phosphopantothenate--cysteine ligase CoaBC [Microbacterium sp. Yaish 1]|uniref:bifunctional phosphopantothenoylcysteine decarboxylase/phosphopantothenate--cysteine ligase CoaBC n=1 Tax=Microbacterium sp. Yaish 1 TaxID=2025014 RepID=UPI000B94307B|nr:bifunctional phosphopantothenoylcysteine decarboxylase/phosphopantothenate--cysteine ligase CoaBC [Microbacterium sp. Yaish 1]OYC97266.1 bifunctional phosphopantothenoylcysteine decarboxylase/phosphopantothenate--cysteine ligase CoaBC [Microbacterium sp. Yaish 1]
MFIVVGVTGGIAAYKSVHLVRLLVQQGHEVHVIPTEDSLRFIGLTTWEAISRNPVTTSVHDDVARVRHVALGQSADLVIVAPATANTIASMTAGLASDLLGTTLLATTAPVVIAPAMHTEMWRHPATAANVATLRERGVLIVGPADGPLTGGDSGPGRMSEPEDIVAAALALVSPAPADLDGLHVAVSTGGTREPLDPVRFLGNRSSGRQGAEIALEAARRGASVMLVAASVDAGVLDAAAAHPRITIRHVETAAELGEAMSDAAAAAEVVIMVAAVADYRAARVSHHKLRKEDGPLETIELVPNDDILARLAAARRDGQTVVGFAAETADDDLLERARRKRERKGVDLLVVNEVGWDAGFGAGENAVAVIGEGGTVVAEAAGAKSAVARVVWDAIVATRAGR